MSDRPAATAVTTTNRRRYAKESGQHDAESGTDEGPPRERGERYGLAVDLETDTRSAGDGCHHRGAHGREDAGDRTGSKKIGVAHLCRECATGSLVGGVWGGRSSLPRLVEMRGEVVEDFDPAGHHFGEELVLPIRSVSVSTRDDADHATAAGR